MSYNRSKRQMNQLNFTSPIQISRPSDAKRSANHTIHDFRPGAYFNDAAIAQGDTEGILWDGSDSKSIIEAFDEHVLREQLVMQRIFRKRGARAREIKPLSVDQTQADDTVALSRLREEQIRAHTVAVDINAALRPQPNTDFLRAIDCLQKAEIMNDFDKAVQAAEQAAHHSNVEQAEQAAAYGARDFQFGHIEQLTSVLQGGHEPLEIISFLGQTKDPNALD